MIKALIFDFDGVIAESVQVKTNAFAKLYSNYGKKIVAKVTQHHEENGGMSRYKKFKYYHCNFLNISLDTEEINNLADRFSNLVKHEVINAPYVTGSLNFIKNNHTKYKQFISTGTPTNEIKYILKKRKINNYFLDTYGSPQEKVSHIENIKDKYSLRPNEMIFFGDSRSDMEAAINSKVKFILIRHKFNVELVNNYNGIIINDFFELNNTFHKNIIE